MKKSSRYQLVVPTVTTVVMALCLTFATPALADPGEEYKKMPGYVDFAALGIFGKIEPSVEVFLRGPLLKLAREAVKHEEPDLAGALDQIKLIRVNVFPLDEWGGEDLIANTKKLVNTLEKKGWELAVRVHEDDEDVYIYLLPGKNDEIEGLVVMVIEGDKEATFVNIVGTIDPEQIGRIGRAIHIDGLDVPDLEEKIKKNRERRTHRR